MPLYVYECHEHGRFDRLFRMGEAQRYVYCGCGTLSKRVFTVPQFTEDRRRFAGERISAATGQPVAQSRSEERAIAKTLGIEFMSKADLPEHVKAARAYGEHLKAGGERLPNDVAAAMMSPPPEKPTSVLEALRKNPRRLGEIPTDRPIAGKPLPPFPKDVAL